MREYGRLKRDAIFQIRLPRFGLWCSACRDRKTAADFCATCSNDRRQGTERMNLFEGHGNREAKIRYLDGDFQILSPGSYVVCAMTGKQIPLDELRYWSVARQEPYADVISAIDADKRAGVLPNQRR
ncbi:conserved hypothetical protein [Rhizobium johnstonii 3841]|uniref:DUF2093 domain-containing protein n=11 Tax=Rhizobium TaxID=379 RepID=Q1MKU8_RHIJ3|nr:conserved hypothetical protein [Rhizobium johnstonii 3841]